MFHRFGSLSTRLTNWADTSAKVSNPPPWYFGKIDDVKQSTEDLDNEETGGKTRRRFLLRFYRVWNVEQCELPQAVIEKLPKIETHEHNPIEAAERIIATMPQPARDSARRLQGILQ